MINLKKHIENMSHIKSMLEGAYKSAKVDYKQQSVLWKLSEFKMIHGNDKRLDTLNKNSVHERDMRKNNKCAFLAKCPYFRYKKSISFNVHVQSHDGKRSYKDTVWDVKYPKSTTAIFLDELIDIGNVDVFLDKLSQITEKWGRKFSDMDNNDFKKALLGGYYLVYKVMFKEVTSTQKVLFGYAFVERGRGKDTCDCNIYTLLDDNTIHSKFCIVSEVLEGIPEAIISSLKMERDKFRENVEAKKKVTNVGCKQDSDSGKGKCAIKDKSGSIEKSEIEAAERAAEADNLRMVLGLN